jgi:PPK2 family polyphosphate:nucleotide phosphotransferase
MSLRQQLRVPVGQDFDLSTVDPSSTPGLTGKKASSKWARKKLKAIGDGLSLFQEQLFATATVTGTRRRVVLLLQAMDCGGKDGTVKKVAGTMNPGGLSVVGFGKPTAEELRHDFLWRIRKAVPPPGQFAVFNRSQYEDVLIVRVHNLVPPEVWEGRYDQINAFEAELTAAGVTILKVMLHISRDEQKARLDKRLHDPTKYWKFDPADLQERGFWDDYQSAYNVALSRCSTEIAPWHVVPANHKWYRDWAVATLLHETLADLDLSYPPPSFDVHLERKRLAKA